MKHDSVGGEWIMWTRKWNEHGNFKVCDPIETRVRFRFDVRQ